MKAIIIGGGIAGLSTAIALEQAGIECHVFEAAPMIREVGAGIWLAPNAMQVFHNLGIGEAKIPANMNPAEWLYSGAQK